MKHIFDKEKLLTESQKLDFVEVELDSIFESLDLDEDTLEKLTEAFVLASRNGATILAEQHLEEMAQFAQGEVERIESEIVEEYNDLLEKGINTVLESVAQTWLEENQVAIENSVKAELFDSLLEGLKTTLVEHNVAIPAEKVELYDELVQEEKSTREHANQIFLENEELKEELQAIKRERTIEKYSVGLVESQKETFQNLAKAIQYDESYEDRVKSLSESLMTTVKDKKTVTLEEDLAKSSKKSLEDESVINEGQDEEAKKVRTTTTRKPSKRNFILNS